MNHFCSKLVNDRSYCTLHFDTTLIDCDLVSRSQCKKANTSVAIISPSFQWIWMEFDIMLRLVGVIYFIHNLSDPFDN